MKYFLTVMDINFKKLTVNDIIEMQPYFEACNLRLSDYSAAFKLMWQKHFALDFAYVNDCVVFREYYQGKVYFHFPMELEAGKSECAMDSIEQYCRENNIRIHYTCVSREKMDTMIVRYGMEMRITNHRRWRDYLYNAEDFKTYSGKKFSGQRNHVNKLKKNYPNYSFRELNEADIPQIENFLKKYEKRQLAKGTVMAKEEMEGVYELLEYIAPLKLKAGALFVDENMIALSIGERCGEQLIIHVEKALTEYEGAYPAMAQEFARHFAAEGVKYINREDDAGDAGLRKSKLQYNPISLVDKYDIFPRRAVDRVSHIPMIVTQRLTLREITEMNALEFFRLEYDAERNKYWGYNWREHYSGEPSPQFFMQGIREDFNNREEIPMGIFLGKNLIGEVVLHNFGYRNDCEVGVRLLPEYEGAGYAKEAVLAAMNYAFFDMNIETVLAKCFKPNGRSRAMLLASGMRPCGEDETYYHFRKTAAM